MIKIRTFTMDRSVAMIQEVFSKYVEPVAKSYMKGEIPQILLTIHRQGTKDKDWLAQVRLKETSSVSLFRCDIYLEDIHRLCRHCRLYLQTEQCFPVIVLWFVLHPLFQSQYNEFTADIVTDYDAMMIGAGDQTYDFIMSNLSMRSPFKRAVLDVLRYNMMILSHTDDPDVGKKLVRATRYYQKYCLEHHREAYNVSSLRRGHSCMIDPDGYMIVERLTQTQKKE